jgi:hypothetical protein
MSKKILFCLFILFSACITEMESQVIIGKRAANQEPNPFSALDLVSTEGGLRPPQMTSAQRDIMLSGLGASTDAYRGMLIYNTDNDSIQFYKNATEGWVSIGTEVGTAYIPVDPNVIIRPYDSSRDGYAGSNLIAGKARYDVNQTSGSKGGSCGFVGQGRANDFSTDASRIRHYVIQFPSGYSGHISDLVVGERQSSEAIISKVYGSVFGPVSLLTDTIGIHFAPNVVSLATGKTDVGALQSTLYAVFKKDGVMYKAEYRVSVMDCLGCGVRLQTGEKGWMRVSCFNLSTNGTPASPFNYSPDIQSDSIYQWGRKEAISKLARIYEPKPALGELAYPTAPRDSLDTNGQPVGERVGKFIPVTTHSGTLTGGSQPFFQGDWSVQHKPDLWGDGSQTPYTNKSVNDPCPAGFKIPTKSEMQQLLDALTYSSSGNGATAKDDGKLFLPHNFGRTVSGAIETNPLFSAVYWTGTVVGGGTGTPISPSVNALVFNGSSAVIQTVDRAYGGVVRCIGDY